MAKFCHPVLSKRLRKRHNLIFVLSQFSTGNCVLAKATEYNIMKIFEAQGEI